MNVAPPEPSRSLGLQGASNFRDLGGYRAADGRKVRWRTVFRSDHLAGLTSQDLDTLSRLGIDRSLDFRGAQERAAASYRVAGVTQHSLSIEPTVVQGIRALLDAGDPVGTHEAIELMRDTYRHFITDNSNRFREFFALLLERATPLVFHCTAGKDRTGFAASLFLQALGVSRATVMQDFLLTNELYRRPVLSQGSELTEPVAEVIWSVKASFLQAAHDLIDEKYGGTESYLHAIGVSDTNQDRLRELYLQAA